MDRAGAGVGVTSLLLQIAGGCVQAFSFWSRGNAISEEATIFQVRLEGQAAKFKAWGVGWGIDFGPNATPATDEKFGNGDLVIRYVVIIHQFLDALRDLGLDFPVIKLAEELSLSGAALLDRVGDLSDPQAEARREYRKKLQDLRQDTTVREKVKWAYQNGGPLKTLELLKEMIEDLYDVFPPPKKDPVAEHVLNAILASLDIAKLKRLSQDSESSTLRGLAHLKTMILQMEARNVLLQVEGDVWEKSRQLKDVGTTDKVNERSLARFREQPVLVEWKSVDEGSGTEHTVMVKQRIQLLARLLKAKLKLRELRTLECLGVVRQPGPGDGDINYGMIFATPSAAQPRSLHDILNSPDELALDDWLGIAKNAAEAVLFLHMAGWLHKAIRSDNLLFFDSNDYSDLRIVGFEYSRQASSAQQTEGMKDDFDLNLYRHPDVQSGLANHSEKVSFIAKHDVYSLGIILLEIGLRQTVSSLYRAAAGTLQADADKSGWPFMRHLLGTQVVKLKGPMGKTYCGITRRCLEGNIFDDQGKTEPEALYLGVLRPLEQFRVD